MFEPCSIVRAVLCEKESAAYLSISLSTIRRWRKRNTGPVYFRVGDILRYGQRDLDEFIAINTGQAS